ncbi:MarR family transcriptional regulator [Streptomyces gibsoniae]|uniref:MarR family transcriptional regulator n=1 Tax=Streptomyces gibsoniae TaxID=3075529 RepID=A0ABU2U296_9ACTN|nr:MarR family transcriptional regulator [Streptomyces sp. DSM 41699]MDT0467342.1 MarR family transcriptional regulator [Streptomyces sp. DSM 41699]
MTQQDCQRIASGLVREIVELAVRSGMPRMAARVHVDLLLSEGGRRTAAELTRRLKVSPTSVSVAENFLVQQGFVRRKRAADSRRRRPRRRGRRRSDRTSPRGNGRPRPTRSWSGSRWT